MREPMYGTVPSAISLDRMRQFGDGGKFRLNSVSAVCFADFESKLMPA
jgi:hypothetical protein